MALIIQDILDFGIININTTSEKVYEIKNTSSIDKTFTVEKFSDDPKVLDCGFKLWTNSSKPVKPNEVLKINVSFTPKVVNTKCSDYLIIKPSFGAETIVFLKGISDVGAKCFLSNNHLKIICPSDKKKFLKRFEIMNKGNLTVNFNFIADKEYSQIITLDPLQGKIQPSKSVSVTVTYKPAGYGIFFKRLFCLVEYHEPLILDIYAILLKNNGSSSFPVVKENFILFKNNYHCFMNNVMNRVTISELPLISINNCNIDFSHCLPKKERRVEFLLTNNSTMKLMINWIQSLQNPFKVYPCQSELEVDSSVAFSVSFKPQVKNMLFGTLLEAQLFSNYYLLPYPVDVNLKGHTFDQLSCGWAAQYKVVPNQVLLPPCVADPLDPSHTTFNIYRFGHLPLAFKFHPPNNTNFTVKPQQGLIRENFEIIMVQFHPKELNDAIYTEKWMISFNSNEIANHCYVDFKGSVETPQIIINHGREVVFPKTHPRSPYELLVDLYNPTRFSFWYSESVLKGDTVLMVGSGGEIWPYEHKQVTWSFCPRGVGELEALVCCSPIMKASLKVKSTMAVVKGTCEKTELQVIPHGLLYQGVLRGCEHERGFEMTNIGEAFISGTLMWLPQENCSPDDVVVRFEPARFSILPGASLLINAILTPLRSGSRSILIGYSINDNTATPFISVFINCVFPCLQVGDLRINNAGPLFTRLDFWKTLQINRLNESLLNLTAGENKEVMMYFPSYTSTHSVVTVELLMENHSNIGMFVNLTREKMCDCKPVLTSVSFSQSEWQNLCPHKTQVQITPLKSYISPGDYTVLKVHVSFTTKGYVYNVFKVSIIPEDYENVDCMMELCFGRTSIPEGAPYIDTTDPKEQDHFVFNMKPAFIGECYPFVQGFNLYNNTKQSVFYEVNDKALLNTPFKYIGKRNTISPMSNHILLFTFLPNKCEAFEAKVEFVIDDYPTKLILKGSGISDKNGEHNRIWLPEQEILNIIDPSQFFISTSHFSIGPMKPTCSQKHVLFLNNKTKDLVSFKWHTTKIPGVVKLQVHPLKGAVQPGDVVECRLVVHSKGWPCHLTSSITCVFASFTKYANTARAMQKYREESVTCLDYFIITEEGTETVEMAPPREEWPKKSYLTLSVDIEVKYDTIHDQDKFLPFTPFVVQTHQLHESLVDSSNEHKLFLNQVMEMVLFEALEDLKENKVVVPKKPLERYAQVKELSYQTDLPVPHHITKATIEDLLYSVWRDVFRIKPRSSTEHLRKTLIYQLQQGSRSVVTSTESLTEVPLISNKTSSTDSHSY